VFKKPLAMNGHCH